MLPHGINLKSHSSQLKVLLVVSLLIWTYYCLHTTSDLSSIVSKTSSLGHSASANEPRYAYSTFLTDTGNATQDAHYLEALRILIYQLKHDPSTRSPASLPIVVLTTNTISPTIPPLLTSWGADLIHTVPREPLSWQREGETRWHDVLTKIRLHDLTQFTKILFLDADSLLLSPLDDIFTSPTTDPSPTGFDPDRNRPNDAPLPATYVFAAEHDNEEYHHWPPISFENGDYWGSNDYLNSGFYVIAPDPVMLAYYRGLMAEEGRFVGAMPEQGLFNYAHRSAGNMPWVALEYWWNTRVPMRKDLEGGVRSVHEKWWQPFDPELMGWIAEVRERVDAFYGGGG